MKRSDMTVGMTVENERGTLFRVVSTEGWKGHSGFGNRPTGVEFDGHPVVASASKGANGLLAVRVVTLALAPVGEPVVADVLQLRYTHPKGSANARRKAEQAALKESVEADIERQEELLAQARHIWGDKADALMEACGVVNDGLLTEREEQTLRTIIMCGENR